MALQQAALGAAPPAQAPSPALPPLNARAACCVGNAEPLYLPQSRLLDLVRLEAALRGGLPPALFADRARRAAPRVSSTTPPADSGRPCLLAALPRRRLQAGAGAVVHTRRAGAAQAPRAVLAPPDLRHRGAARRLAGAGGGPGSWAAARCLPAACALHCRLRLQQAPASAQQLRRCKTLPPWLPCCAGCRLAPGAACVCLPPQPQEQGGWKRQGESLSLRRRTASCLTTPALTMHPASRPAGRRSWRSWRALGGRSWRAAWGRQVQLGGWQAAVARAVAPLEVVGFLHF